MNLFDNDTKSINDSAFEDLKVGKHPYRITGMKVVEKEGKKNIAGSFKHLHDGTLHGYFFGISEEGDQGRIAKQAMKALWDATGLQGAPGLDRLPNFIDKIVDIDAYAGKTGTQGRAFVNIKSIHAYVPNGSTPAPVKQEYHQPEDDDKIDTSPSTPAAAPVTTAEATTPPAAASTKPKKWPGAKK